MRRAYEYLLIAALIFVAIITAIGLTNSKPPEPQPLSASAIWAPYEYLPDDGSPHTIDGASGCLVLGDGRDFACARTGQEDRGAAGPPANGTARD